VHTDPAATVVSLQDREAFRSDALGLGFLQVGFAPAAVPPHAEAYLAWLRDGLHGEMGWMGREDAVRRRLDPRHALPGCRTLIMVSLSYASASGPALHATAHASDPEACRVARYAGGRDYHQEFEERLDRLRELVRLRWPAAVAKPYVDYGPVLERGHAQRAGLGWLGKNTMLIHPQIGSWTLLGELLTTVAIPPDEPFEADRCGTCTRCIEACPTGAITGPRVLDARLCISYLTIELRGSIPESLRPAIGNRVFGCDICQEVCPWNDGAAAGELAALATRWRGPVPRETLMGWAEELLDLTDEQFRSRYGETPFSRPGREGLLRNLCVGLGNTGNPAVLPVVLRCLSEESPLVREHAAWALARVAGAGSEPSPRS
jgi:epoxyqueuosine reductase